jgi:KAP-like P-loop domain-containing protein
VRKAKHTAPDRDTDAFGHRDYAHALTEVLLDAEPPFTMGLFGPWGVGKTTILDDVRARIRADHGTTTAFIQVAAWRSEGESFRREFLRAAEQQLVAAGALPRRHRRVTSDLYATSTRSHERLGWSPVRLFQLALAIAALGGVLYWAGVRSGHDLVHRTDLRAPIAVFLAMFAATAYVLSLALAVIQPRVRSVTALRLEEPERFTERFASLLGAVTRRRVIIAIDDVDRMSSPEAVDILRTVKTFLEPTTALGDPRRAGPAVVFVVAADRAMLRAHVAAELAEGAPRFGDTRTAEQLADDYLAKFFSASVSVRPVLDDDMHVYMRAHIAQLMHRIDPGRGLDERIVRMCVAGLRHNPRRVKQFASTMELRWHLVRARERSWEAPEGEAPLSSDLATIVKLTLIEEEWPQALERLQERPGALAAWSALAADGAAPGDDEWGGEDWEHFASFLRASHDVAPSSLRPFLRLRRSVVERELPRYDAFHGAATCPGSPEAVAAFVQDLDYHLMTRYAARMTDIMREELRYGNLDGTVHCLEAALNVPHLTGHSFDFRAILEAAIAEPALRPSLQRVSPVPLVYAARVIGGGVQSTVEVALADHIIATASRGESPGDAARALAGEPLTLLSPAARERLRSAFGASPLIDAFEHYLPLLAARCMGFPDGVAEHALRAVTAPREPLVLRGAGAAWEVLVDALHEGNSNQGTMHCSTTYGPS